MKCGVTCVHLCGCKSVLAIVMTYLDGCFGPKMASEAISEHFNTRGGVMHPDPPTFCMHKHTPLLTLPPPIWSISLCHWCNADKLQHIDLCNQRLMPARVLRNMQSTSTHWVLSNFQVVATTEKGNSCIKKLFITKKLWPSNFIFISRSLCSHLPFSWLLHK